MRKCKIKLKKWKTQNWVGRERENECTAQHCASPLIPHLHNHSTQLNPTQLKLLALTTYSYISCYILLAASLEFYLFFFCEMSQDAAKYVGVACWPLFLFLCLSRSAWGMWSSFVETVATTVKQKVCLLFFFTLTITRLHTITSHTSNNSITPSLRDTIHTHSSNL